MVAVNKGEQVPEGWIIDRDGAPTTDPKAFYDGGALLTVGAHKGSGLSIVTDLLAGAVSTDAVPIRMIRFCATTCFRSTLRPRVYAPDGWVTAEARRFVDWVKASPPMNAASRSWRRATSSGARARSARRTAYRSTTRRCRISCAARSVGIDDAEARALLA